jgi:hypothetical protein
MALLPNTSFGHTHSPKGSYVFLFKLSIFGTFANFDILDVYAVLDIFVILDTFD